ncbi:deoxyribose-phosphate aldolase [Balneolaceae bacterium ANBcel3]|nr:deoxyribose-phosphate aldolase [Balneolaceae bacterium ANBcel3]
MNFVDMNSSVKEIAKMIDHAILHPAHTDAELLSECKVASEYQAASVCVKPYVVALAHETLADSGVLTCSVIGFPAGNSSIQVKAFETETAIKEGATEIDMVINIGKALGGDWAYVEEEIKTLTDLCHTHNAIVKVIFETDYITNEKDKIRLCEICSEVKADYVKTSTGFGYVKQQDGSMMYQGATLSDIMLMRAHSAPAVKVKASGGIKTLDDLLAMKEAGADRIGASATRSILEEAKIRFS